MDTLFKLLILGNLLGFCSGLAAHAGLSVCSDDTCDTQCIGQGKVSGKCVSAYGSDDATCKCSDASGLSNRSCLPSTCNSDSCPNLSHPTPICREDACQCCNFIGISGTGEGCVPAKR